MTYSEAAAMLPAGSVWSSSFGYPGEGGYVEYHRTPDGERWTIKNGTSYLDSAPFCWSCERGAK